ncbi:MULTISPECIES: histone-like nucleoid-structuring protein Lsr2 [Actinomadura]|uniref:Lsr2 family protein n=2 Tax=Actinomadura TaxID=1988 RepID=A0A5D0NK44_9ACTN|nr:MULTISPECIES: Lsr2 family protein [Actinomadura]TYB44807.1 Lsr2 family protein [Actinomadura chibensis]TYK47712.1 Lsr2 family protein [Actinomadura decatromicini]
MAEKVIRVDDIDGAEGGDVAKRDFQVLGRTFTIDLSDDNFSRLNGTLDALAPFIENAVEVKPAGKGRKSPAAKIKGYTNGDVRAWALRSDIEVSERGKISDEVYAAFIEAHPDAKPEA